jgi:hypothetical protein
MGMKFSRETDLCAAFLKAVPEGWTSYPETGGFDILLSHDSTGFQIGVEAKLVMNAKVVEQALPSLDRSHIGPDFRAILTGSFNKSIDMICRHLGVTSILMREGFRGQPTFRPNLPDMIGGRGWGWYDQQNWFDWGPDQRIELPEYIPDVAAGASAPIRLSPWKIKAIKVCIFVERTGKMTRRQFCQLRISPTMWLDGRIMKKGDVRGEWVAGPCFPADRLRRDHAENFKQIEDDFEKWAKPLNPT